MCVNLSTLMMYLVPGSTQRWLYYPTVIVMRLKLTGNMDYSGWAAPRGSSPPLTSILCLARAHPSITARPLFCFCVATDSAIFMEDSAADVKRKVRASWHCASILALLLVFLLLFVVFDCFAFRRCHHYPVHSSKAPDLFYHP